ncbi:MAG: tyrosine-type recombinase/integrase [Pedobacter sp.]|uniref:tyrosine-type recombinase/integrase n=2 Tax=Bacteroidota TaxID=976 RepID=UPI00280960E7|nr:tyrosine-type recombinase/integrase [Pedobacter sp.]MDQ8005496.1 tyrosine-type recombinase/integrase [Pedobacter sp.]
MLKKTKKQLYLHYELGIYKGVSFKLVIPTKHNKEKYPNYCIQYNGSKRYYIGVKDVYIQFIELEKVHQTTENLINMYLPIIQEQIYPSINQIAVVEGTLKLTSLVTFAINKYFKEQERLSHIGELVDITDYRDRNKKLNNYFADHLGDKLKLSDLNKDVWSEFRFYLLANYKIKSNSTVNQYIVYVKSFYNWLQNDQELNIVNHAVKLKRLDTSKQELKYGFVEHGLVNEYLDTLKSDERWLRLNIISLLVYENAKRPVQAYRLQAKDVDLERKTLYLTPKSRKKAKEVTFISDELAELIGKVYVNTINSGRIIEPDDYLLGGRNCFKKGGKAISQGDIRDTQIVKFRKLYPKFKDILIYSLKHTTITTIAQHDLGLAQRMANHSNQSTTEIYNRGKQSSQAIPRERLLNEFKEK